MTEANGIGRRVTTAEAQLTTATVEIETITVSGKQMTLAVFRQLIEEPLIDFNVVIGPLLGVPWGRVNYHSGVGCEDFKDTEHLHVIWQKGAELRRSCVLPDADPFQDIKLYEKHVALHTLRRIAEGWKPDERDMSYDNDNTFVEVTHAYGRMSVALSPLMHHLIHLDEELARMDVETERLRRDGSPRADSIANARQKLCQEMERKRAEILALGSSAESEEQLHKHEEMVRYIHERHASIYEDLQRLPQLFIAV